MRATPYHATGSGRVARNPIALRIDGGMSDDGQMHEDPGTTESVSARDLSAGDVLSATWHLDGLLGQGGMATVFAATDVVGRRAAIKVMRAEVMDSPGALKRFLREARFARRVTHPAMVRWLGDGTTDDGRPYMALDLLEGRTLEGLPRSQTNRPSVRGVLDVIAEVLELLADCHGQGIIHRDVKPANILVTREGAVKVLDFGLAHATDLSEDLVRPGTAMGTPSFMAPEQAMGAWDQVDARSDVYSVGATMFALLTGTMLHQGRTEAESFTLAATRSAPSIHEVDPSIPAVVASLVDRALRWDKRTRFADAKQMQAALDQVLSAFDPAEDEPLFHPVCEPVPMDTRDLALDDATPVCRASAEGLRRFDEALLDVVNPRALLEDAASILASAVAEDPIGVTWTFLPWCVRIRGTTVWRPGGAGLALLQAMFDDGLRWLEIAADARPDRLRELFDAWYERALRQRPRSTDTVWDLWPLQGEGLSVGITTGATASLEPEGASSLDGLRAAMRLLDGTGGVSERTPRLESLGPGEVLAIMAGAEELERLREQTCSAPRHWADAFCACVAKSIAVTDPDAPGNPGAWLSNIARDLLHASRPDLLLGAAKQLCADEHAARVLPLLLPPQIIGKLMLAVASHRASDLDDRSVMLLGEVLAALDGSYAAEVVEALPDVSDTAVIGIATDFVERHAARAAEAIRARLHGLRGGCGYRLTRALAGLEDDASRDALIALSRDEGSSMRIVARAALYGDVANDDDVSFLLGAPGWGAREVALRTVKDFGVTSLAPVLRERARDPAFHLLGMQERVLTMEAILALELEDGLDVIEGLVRSHGLLRDDAWNETRVLAAGMLAKLGRGASSVEALRSAEAPMWWNPPTLRAEARKAREALEARQAAQEAP